MSSWTSFLGVSKRSSFRSMSSDLVSVLSHPRKNRPNPTTGLTFVPTLMEKKRSPSTYDVQPEFLMEKIRIIIILQYIETPIKKQKNLQSIFDRILKSKHRSARKEHSVRPNEDRTRSWASAMWSFHAQNLTAWN